MDCDCMKHMRHIKNIDEIRKEDVARVGGKGASLGEMSAAGIPVPDGFVILTDAFEGFIHEAQLTAEIEALLKSVDITVIHTIENASERIQALIMAAPLSDDLQCDIREAFEGLATEYVAVRSSATAEDGATAAWAGQLDTFLNTTQSTLIENVKKCWASLFTPRALFYRFEKDLHDQHISVAVVVQAMVQSEVSGIAFSVHPVTEDHNQMIVEAGLGLGEAIVSGAITPDSYVVEKDFLSIFEKTVSEQKKGLYCASAGNEWKELGEKGSLQKLSDAQIIELSKLVVTIEAHYGFPVDIEWALEGGKFYITQSRPITTLHTLSETDPSKSIVDSEIIGVDWIKLMERKNTILFLNLIIRGECSRDFMAKIIGDGLLATTYQMSLCDIFYVSSSEQEKIHDHLRERILGEGYAFLHTFVRIWEDGVKDLLDFSKKINTEDVPDEIQEISSRMSELFDKNRVVSTSLKLPLFIEPFLEDEVRKIIKKRDYIEDRHEGLFELLIRPLKLSETEKEYRALLMLASQITGGSDDEELIEAHGNEFGWLNTARLYGEPWTKEDVMRKIANIDNPVTRLKEVDVKEKTESKRYDVAVAELNLSAGEKEAIGIAKEYVYYRTLRIEAFLKAGYLARPFYEKTAKRIGVKYKDFINLTIEEILKSLKEGMICVDRDALLSRNKAFAFVVIPDERFFVFHGDELKILKNTLDKKLTVFTVASQQVHGVSAQKGMARGFVKKIKSILEINKIFKGDILVVSMTLPDMMPAIILAGGIVTDEGGITCHAAIVARELKKPCIIATKFATQLLKDGDLVEVDANEGVVRIIKRNE